MSGIDFETFKATDLLALLDELAGARAALALLTRERDDLKRWNESLHRSEGQIMERAVRAEEERDEARAERDRARSWARSWREGAHFWWWRVKFSTTAMNRIRRERAMRMAAIRRVASLTGRLRAVLRWVYERTNPAPITDRDVWGRGRVWSKKGTPRGSSGGPGR